MTIRELREQFNNREISSKQYIDKSLEIIFRGVGFLK